MGSNNDRSLPFEYFRGFLACVQSPYNGWVTGVTVGHPPTWEDKLVHFVVNGGPQDFHRSFMEAHPGAIFLESR